MTRLAIPAVLALALAGCVTVDTGFDQRCQKYLAAAELGFNIAGTFVNIGPDARTLEQRVAAAISAGCAPPAVVDAAKKRK